MNKNLGVLVIAATLLILAPFGELLGETNPAAGKFGGLGMALYTKGSRLIIGSVIEGTPAEVVGLKVGDVIAGVNGKKTVGLNVKTAVGLLRGKAGTKVTLTIIRKGLADPFDLTLTREIIQAAKVDNSSGAVSTQPSQAMAQKIKSQESIIAPYKFKMAGVTYNEKVCDGGHGPANPVIAGSKFCACNAAEYQGSNWMDRGTMDGYHFLFPGNGTIQLADGKGVVLTAALAEPMWNQFIWKDANQNIVWVQLASDGSSFTFSRGPLARPGNEGAYDPNAEYAYTWLSKP
jgi:hypothetical protein